MPINIEIYKKKTCKVLYFILESRQKLATQLFPVDTKVLVDSDLCSLCVFYMFISYLYFASVKACLDCGRTTTNLF